ncbi:hypothetical protein LEP1GSC051_3239 [Leptospira sp. P2653]|nr:hypothetical protein LEP1GSC051_3239 [Leptospira sp. P2653]
MKKFKTPKRDIISRNHRKGSAFFKRIEIIVFESKFDSKFLEA